MGGSIKMATSSKGAAKVSVMAPGLPAGIVAVKDLARALLTQLDRMKESPSLSISAGMEMRAEVKSYEIELIRTALHLTGNHQRRAASLLGITPSTLNTKIKRHHIES